MGHFAGKVAKRHVNFVKWPDASAGRGDAGNQVVPPGNCLAVESRITSGAERRIRAEGYVRGGDSSKS